MKWLFLIFGLHFITFPSWSQDVIVNVNAFGNREPASLESIRIHNVTRDGLLVLNNLPGNLTSYRINLSQGSLVLGIDEPGEEIFPPQVLTNVPGWLKFTLNTDQVREITLKVFDLTGKQLAFRQYDFPAGNLLVEITGGPESMLIAVISSRNFQKALKFAGNGSALHISVQNQKTEVKSTPVITPDCSPVADDSPGFLFEPGDLIRIVGIKTGFYTGMAEAVPQNEDHYDLYLTSPCSGTPTVSDYDGNTYQTVQIGNQCWMRQNLNVTHTPKGVPLVDGTGVGPIDMDFTTPYWFNYNDSVEYSWTYGKLYTWAAIMNGSEGSNSNPSGVQGICPDGWHIPSDEEWMDLERFIGMSESEVYQEDWRGIVGNNLKETGTLHWDDQEWDAPDFFGFKAIPGGIRASEGGFYIESRSSYFMTSTKYPYNILVVYRLLADYHPGIARYYDIPNSGTSLRCVKD